MVCTKKKPTLVVGWNTPLYLWMGLSDGLQVYHYPN